MVVMKDRKLAGRAESGVNWFEMIHSVAGSVHTFILTEVIIVFCRKHFPDTMKLRWCSIRIHTD